MVPSLRQGADRRLERAKEAETEKANAVPFHLPVAFGPLQADHVSTYTGAIWREDRVGRQGSEVQGAPLLLNQPLHLQATSSAKQTGPCLTN